MIPTHDELLARIKGRLHEEREAPDIHRIVNGKIKTVVPLSVAVATLEDLRQAILGGADAKDLLYKIDFAEDLWTRVEDEAFSRRAIILE